MKKKYLLGILISLVCITLVGCTKKDTKWTTIYEEREVYIDEDIKNIFTEATKDYKTNLNLIALLGEQVVAGTNYMFLSETEKDNTIVYKVIVVYKDLQGNISLTYDNDLDITKYANKDISFNADNFVGGWEVSVPGKPIMLADKIQTSFDKATEDFVGTTYYPIKVLAQQNDNYAIICYGRLSDQNGTTGIFVITLDTKKDELVTIAAVDLKDYNK